jgi:hypothetical protein
MAAGHNGGGGLNGKGDNEIICCLILLQIFPYLSVLQLNIPYLLQPLRHWLPVHSELEISIQFLGSVRAGNLCNGVLSVTFSEQPESFGMPQTGESILNRRIFSLSQANKVLICSVVKNSNVYNHRHCTYGSNLTNCHEFCFGGLTMEECYIWLSFIRNVYLSNFRSEYILRFLRNY